MSPFDADRDEPNDLTSPLMTVAEVGRALRVSTMTVYRLIHNGELRAIRIGGSFRVTEKAYRAFVEQKGSP